MNRKNLIKLLISLIFFIFLVNYVAMRFYWYSAIWWFDMLMHFLGGFWLGLAFIWVSEGLKLFLESKALAKAVFKILFFVLLAGLGWEIFEFLVNDIIIQNPFNFLDTISDILFGLFGGLCAILYLWKSKSK